MEHTELYEILGVSKTSTDAEIRKNYRKLAKEFHPDKNPEAGDKFKEISFAYEVLSNPEKRRVYDNYGIKGLQEGSDSFGDASEFFAQWFPFSGGHGGGGGPGCSRSSNSRAKAMRIVVNLQVTLEEIYNGNVSKVVEYKRSEYCTSCHGKGGPEDAIEQCTACGGAGRTTNYAFLGLSALETICSACYGRGAIVKDDQRCTNCSGYGLVDVDQTREITIEKGAPNMLKIPFAAEGNQTLTGERGDLIVVLVQAEHPAFIRRQNDLFLRGIHISLTEALCGFVHCFQHLDGRNICISNKPGEVIKHGDMKMVSGEGMPLRNNPFERGDLFVEFRIDFPDNNFATSEQMKTLESILPPRELFVMPEEAEEVQMAEVQPYGEGAGAHGGADNEDEEEDYQHVQCQTA